MARPLVLVVPEPELARKLGADFRYPVIEEPGHVHLLVGQGFCVVCVEHPGEIEADIIEVDSGLEHGAAHQHIAAAGLDPLKLNADVGTFAWVTDDDDNLLMVKQAYGRGLWGLPGGELQIAENPDAAVAREVREETGLDVSVERLVAIYGRRQHIGLYFACTPRGGDLRDAFDTEVAAVGWFDPDDPPAPTSPVIGLLKSDLASGQAAARFF